MQIGSDYLRNSLSKVANKYIYEYNKEQHAQLLKYNELGQKEDEGSSDLKGLFFEVITDHELGQIDMDFNQIRLEQPFKL